MRLAQGMIVPVRCAGSALQNCKSQFQLQDKIIFQNHIVAYMFLWSEGQKYLLTEITVKTVFTTPTPMVA